MLRICRKKIRFSWFSPEHKTGLVRHDHRGVKTLHQNLILLTRYTLQSQMKLPSQSLGNQAAEAVSKFELCVWDQGIYRLASRLLQLSKVFSCLSRCLDNWVICSIVLFNCELLLFSWALALEKSLVLVFIFWCIHQHSVSLART